MSKKDKLIQRFQSNPKDWTYEEMIGLLKMLGYVEQKIGHSTGSAVCFRHKKKESMIRFHRPHPSNVIKSYIIKNIKMELEREGLL